MDLAELERLKDEFEADGRQATGVYFTAEQARALRHELHMYYSRDPGPDLMTVFGLEPLSVTASELRFEE